MVEKQFHVPPLAGLTKGWIFVFLEAVPRLAISHLLQPVGRLCWGLQLLLLLLFLFFFFLFSLLLPPPPPQNSQSVSGTRISLKTSSWRFIFSPAIAPDLQQSALFRLQCMAGHSWRNVKPLWYERLLQWQQYGSKAMMWQLYKIPAIQGCPKHFYEIDSCVLHVSTTQPLHITPALKEHVCGPSCSCKHRFWWICLIF